MEFLLIAPMLFFLFFSIIQLAFSSYVSFALQRATNAVARAAAATDDPTQYDPTLQIGYCLAPLGQLDHRTLATVLATQCSIQTDGDTVHVQLSYPMPIWVPVVGNILGRKLSLAPSVIGGMSDSLRAVFATLGKPLPDFSQANNDLPYVRWVDFTCDALDENSVGPGEQG